MNVLIVEDDRSQVKLIRHILTSDKLAEFRLDHAIRLRDALNLLARKPFDAVLLDLRLLDSNGLDTFVTVISAHPTLPIIVLTGMDDEALALETLRRGAQDYLVKSELQAAALVRSLRFAVERKRRMRAEQLLAEVQERERKRLSRELHDGVIQSLSSVRLQLQMSASNSRSSDRFTSASLTRIADDVLGAIDEVRRVCRDLHPAVLECRDLGDALILFAKQIQAESGVAVKVFDRFRGTLSWNLKHHLYRIFQEAVRNAVRHAAVASVTVEYGTRGDKLILEVKDQGQGFDVAAVASAGRGMGLASIRERAELMSGQVLIHSGRHAGTVIRIEIPLGGESFPSPCPDDIATDGADCCGERETAVLCGDTICRDQEPEFKDANPHHAGR